MPKTTAVNEPENDGRNEMPRGIPLVEADAVCFLKEKLKFMVGIDMWLISRSFAGNVLRNDISINSNAVHESCQLADYGDPALLAFLQFV